MAIVFILSIGAIDQFIGLHLTKRLATVSHAHIECVALRRNEGVSI